MERPTNPVDPSIELKTGFVEANGMRIATLSAGPSDGPLALCLHGYPDTAHTWRHLLPRLAAAGYHAVAPFNRGYAPTALAPDGQYEVGALGIDANAIHDALDADADAVLIGHDWGAMGVYAATGLEPQRWRRAVAAAVPPGPVAAAGMFTYDQLRMSWYMFFQLTPLADMVVPMDDFAFITRLWRDWSPAYDPAVDVAHFVDAMTDADNLAAALAYYRHTLQPELQHPDLAVAQSKAFELPAVPLLYLHGGDDGCMSATIAGATAEVLDAQTSKMVLIDGVGHFLHLEAPDRVNGEILAFLGRADPLSGDGQSPQAPSS